MPVLKLPLWFVTEREPKAGDPPLAEDRDTLAFSTFEKLTAFLDYGKAGVWDVVAATEREHLVIVVADVHLRGGDSVYVDPNWTATVANPYCSPI